MIERKKEKSLSYISIHVHVCFYKPAHLYMGMFAFIGLSIPACACIKVGRKIPPLVFTGGIYRYFTAWQIRLKWQILANGGKYNFLPRKTGKYDF